MYNICYTAFFAALWIRYRKTVAADGRFPAPIDSVYESLSDSNSAKV